MEFVEDNGSGAEPSVSCDVGDAIPSDAIGRMGIGFFRPVEEPLMAEREGPSSTVALPSLSQVQGSTPEQPSATQESTPTQDTTSVTQGQATAAGPDDPAPGTPGPSGSQICQDPSPSHDDEAKHSGVDQDIESGQVEDRNIGDDQVASNETIEEANTRREDKTTRHLRLKSHKLEDVLGSVRGKVSTRRQLASFSEHHTYISMVEPQKVYEALEDHDWMDAMHEELNNFKRNNVWTLVEKPKECRNVIYT
jgi:hypothetical protein